MFVKIDGPVVAIGVVLVLGALAMLFPERTFDLFNGARETVGGLISPGMLVPGVTE